MSNVEEVIITDRRETPTGGYACRACNRVFAGLGAFDTHRVGPYEARRCDTSELTLNDRGYWSEGKAYGGAS